MTSVKPVRVQKGSLPEFPDLPTSNARRLNAQFLGHKALVNKTLCQGVYMCVSLEVGVCVCVCACVPCKQSVQTCYS